MIEPSPQFRHLFHGTAGDIEVGQHIVPRAVSGVETAFPKYETAGMAGFNAPEFAYAADSPELAAWYAKYRAEKTGQTPRIFRVEPLNKDDVSIDYDGGRKGSEAYKSPTGFKTVAEVTHLDLSPDNREKS